MYKLWQPLKLALCRYTLWHKGTLHVKVLTQSYSQLYNFTGKDRHPVQSNLVYHSSSTNVLLEYRRGMYLVLCSLLLICHQRTLQNCGCRISASYRIQIDEETFYHRRNNFIETGILNRFLENLEKIEKLPST